MFSFNVDPKPLRKIKITKDTTFSQHKTLNFIRRHKTCDKCKKKNKTHRLRIMYAKRYPFTAFKFTAKRAIYGFKMRYVFA